MGLLVVAAAIAALALILVGRSLRRTNPRLLARSIRYAVGGLVAAIALFVLVRGRAEIALVLGGVAFTIFRSGRVGPIRLEPNTPGPDNRSSVRSRYIAMTLDHATNEITGRVIYGEFQGIDLINLGENETRRLLVSVQNDSDSLALLETWLDRNRAGWREWFATHPAPGPDADLGEDAIAYEVLGLKPGASADEIRAAHRKLMMGVHPDQGGSNFLASKINEAKDRLLKRVKS